MSTQNNCICDDYGIPRELHQNGRLGTDDFTESELLYRRFAPLKDLNGESNILSDGSVSKSVFSTREPMSCNRDKYSSNFKDVLYNIRSAKHYSDWGVCSIQVKIINEFNYLGQNNKRYSLEVVHEPTFCMYPHSNVYVIEDGARLTELKKPDLVKNTIKEYYSKNSTIILKPLPPSSILSLSSSTETQGVHIP